MKFRANGLARQGGGPAANAAVALSRLGVETWFAGAVGTDGLASDQRDALAREGVDVSGVHAVAGASSFVSFILVDEKGGCRTIISDPDERPRLPSDSVRLPDPPPHLILVDGWAGPAQIEVARRAREIGVPLLLDAGSCRPEILELIPECEVVIGSEPFADAYAGPGRPEEAIEKLIAAGPRLAAITRGDRGAVAGASDASGTFPVPAFPVEAVDTTGAGDAFHAGAARALLAGAAWEDSLRYGAAVAALKCRHPGARDGLPVAAEVERRLVGLTDEGDTSKLNS